MTSIILQGVITENGEVQIEFPPDLPPGPIEIEIRLPEVQGISSQEILASDFVGMWEDRTDIRDSIEYARELRQRASRRTHHT
jgi:hypothetical protein